MEGGGLGLGRRVSGGEVRGGCHAYSVVSWGRLGENGKKEVGGYYKQLYHLNIALGSITIPKKKARHNNTHAYTHTKETSQKKNTLA